MGQGTTISLIKEEIIQQEKQIEGILLEIENLRIMKKQCKNWLFFAITMLFFSVIVFKGRFLVIMVFLCFMCVVTSYFQSDRCDGLISHYKNEIDSIEEAINKNREFIAKYKYFSHFYVAGTQYREDRFEPMRVLRCLTYGGETTDVKLVREPDNKYDPNAVKVLVCGYFVGYIPKTASEEVSRLIDRGEKLNLSVDMERQGSYDKGYRAYYELTIYVLNDEKL
ncbi:HIRAN domain-containing protein [Streptococcus suis]|nr:HIRAN domain-containing protein [Streptococcus suis]MBM0242609.1 HIRAN domain-containing protein [Streptococcus suis]MBM7203944.1 HIRAN domain-containing protein [Streptococcus suis]MBM7281670.1 HIRAN domain-containing protein [Streptococcus suis]MBO4135171.1 HIRAN domain-containing protein [Streptococcus suis]